MVRYSNIDTPDERMRTVHALPRGIELLAEFLGSLLLPVDEFVRLANDLGHEARRPQYQDPDLFFRLIKKNFGRPRNTLDLDFDSEIEINANPAAAMIRFSNDAETRASIRKFEEWVDRLAEESDDSLISIATNKVSFDHRPFSDFIDDPTYFYAKVNHGFWEHLVNLRFNRTKVPYYRPLWRVVQTRGYEASGFINMFFSTALKHLKHLGSEQYRDVNFGIAFDSGSNPNIAFSPPLKPLVRGGIIGSLSFLETSHAVLSTDATATLAAGSVPKGMVLNNSFNAFVNSMAQKSDLVMFIVPAHLRDITLCEASDARRAAFVVPSSYVHELWLPVLASAAAAIEQAVSRFGAVTIFTQAGVMSYPLMLLAKLIQTKQAPNCALRYFDLGQVLDIATLQPGTAPAHLWLRNNYDLLAGIQSPFRICPEEVS